MAPQATLACPVPSCSLIIPTFRQACDLVHSVYGCVRIILTVPRWPRLVPPVSTVHIPNQSSVVSGPNSIDDDGLTPEAASRRPTVQTPLFTTFTQLITAKMSQPSLAQYIIKKPALAKWMAPIANWYANAAGYRKLGLRYDTTAHPTTTHCAHTYTTACAHEGV